MKIKLLFVTLLFSFCSWGQIFTNPITGKNPGLSNPYTTGQVFDGNITVSGIGMGSGITGANANNRYNATGWNSASFDATDYFEFTLTPNSGYKIDFTSFEYTSQVSAIPNPNHAFRSSLDGFTTDIGVPTTTGTTISLSGAAYQAITTAITFRFYCYNAKAAGTTFSINDFKFNGLVSALVLCTVPVNQASGIGVSNITSSTADFSWANAAGATGTVVTIRPTATSESAPVYLTTYADNTVYSSAPETATSSGNRVVYVNTGTSTSVTGLSQGTQYTATIYAYNTPNCYNTATPITVTFTTLASGICPPPAGALSGAYAIPSCFPTIASAVTHLNTYGVNGPVVFNVAAGYTETAPNGGFNITATGTATNTITFQKVAGANPVITAYTPQSSGTLTDAIFKIVGGDYITIDGFTLQENNSNTGTVGSTNNMTEFGVALFYASVTNGAQNNTIKNCTIDLNRTYTNTFGIYSNSTHTATNVANGVPATSAAGSNSNLTITGNAITDVNNGIVVIGAITAAAFNDGLVIGGSLANANTITNYGTTTPVSGFIYVSGTVNGIIVRNSINFNVSYNTITSSSFVLDTTSRGVYIDDYSAAPAGTIVNNVNNNSITVTTAISIATISVDLTGVNFGSAGNNNAITNNINNNIISTNYPTATTGQSFGIYYNATAENLNVNNNTVTLNSAANDSSSNFAISVAGKVVTALNINNNTIAATLSTTTTPSASVGLRGISCSGGTTSCSTSISNNNINGLSYVNAGGGATSAIYHNGTPSTSVISNNKFTNLSINSKGTIYLIYNAYKAPANGTKTVTGNAIVTGFARTAAGGGDFYGYYDNLITQTGDNVSHTISNNNFSNITINAASSGDLYGIECEYYDDNTYPTKTNSFTISNNTMSNWVNGKGAIYAINCDMPGGSAGTPNIVSGNTISNLTTKNEVVVYGIWLGTTIGYVDVFGNTISQLQVVLTPATSLGTSDIAGIRSEGPTHEINIYKNKIYGLTGNYTGDGAITGIYSNSATSLNLYNNVIGDLTAPSSNVPGSVTGLLILGGTTYNVYYNTVYLSGSSAGTNYGGYGINIEYNNATLDLRNNLVINNVTPKGTGKSTALYLFPPNGFAAHYSTLSNNNLLYAGTPSAANLIYKDESNSDQTLAAFQALVGSGKDANSVTETAFNPATYFESVIGSDATYLKPKGSCASPSAASNAGTLVPTVLDDYSLVTRDISTPDIGAFEFDLGKNWKGTFDSNWDNANNWSPSGVPTLTDCVTIKSGAANPAIISGDDYAAYALNLSVDNGASLTINTGTTSTKGNSLTVTDAVKVTAPTGSFTINNNSSLIQVTDVASNLNTGNITYKRTATAIKGYDYVYWSSPVIGQTLSGIYSSPTPGYKYSWGSSAGNTSTTTSGNWVAPVLGSGSTMLSGQGYIVRGSSNYSMLSQDITSVFTGVPNNGVISVALAQGSNASDSDDNWNLVGNPYPSSISARNFLKNNSTLLEDALYVWKHLSQPAAIASPFYYDFGYNYNSNDYDEYNLSGNLTDTDPDFYIGAGQGFFVTVQEGKTGSVAFSNSLRNNGYGNSSGTNFFKISNSSTVTEVKEEFNRIWVDLLKEDNSSPVRTMFGYITGATMQRDNLYDAVSTKDDEMNLYSIVNDYNFVIQGRALPFNDSDKVPLGFNILEKGNYKIAIAMVDGLFLNDKQNIYLEDTLLNIIHDLRKSPYSFTTEKGVFNNRFVLRYTAEMLTNSVFDSLNNTLLVTGNNKQLTIISSIENINEVTVYDVLGRQLLEVKNIDSKQFINTSISMSQQTLLVKIKLENGQIVTKKIIL